MDWNRYLSSKNCTKGTNIFTAIISLIGMILVYHRWPVTKDDMLWFAFLFWVLMVNIDKFFEKI